MNFGISLLSSIPMRKEPREQSEMVSQLLFGELYEIVDESEGFLQITSVYDQYPGWIDHALHHEISADYYHQLEREIQPAQAALLMSIEHKGAPPLQILAGSSLPGFNRKKNELEIGDEVWHIRWTFDKFNIHGFSSINGTAAHFLNCPYLWGGRSIFGSDCSGFMQVLYKIHGIKLRRDAYQQAEQGEPVTSLSLAKLGDLAFFTGQDNHVTHVGMVISPSEIVHNSGFVHIDRLDESGIFNLQKQQYTHSLHSIRRIAIL
jgi:hypothetical protein